MRADSDHTVMGDERAIRQVFANLLSNAVKYADPHRPLAVDVRIRRRRSRIWVEVSDNGRGIAEEDQETVFDRFSRSAPADLGRRHRDRARRLPARGRAARGHHQLSRRTGRSRHDVHLRPAGRR